MRDTMDSAGTDAAARDQGRAQLGDIHCMVPSSARSCCTIVPETEAKSSSLRTTMVPPATIVPESTAACASASLSLSFSSSSSEGYRPRSRMISAASVMMGTSTWAEEEMRCAFVWCECMLRVWHTAFLPSSPARPLLTHLGWRRCVGNKGGGQVVGGQRAL